jgi:hypothetical protein
MEANKYWKIQRAVGFCRGFLHLGKTKVPNVIGQLSEAMQDKAKKEARTRIQAVLSGTRASAR